MQFRVHACSVLKQCGRVAEHARAGCLCCRRITALWLPASHLVRMVPGARCCGCGVWSDDGRSHGTLGARWGVHMNARTCRPDGVHEHQYCQAEMSIRDREASSDPTAVEAAEPDPRAPLALPALARGGGLKPYEEFVHRAPWCVDPVVDGPLRAPRTPDALLYFLIFIYLFFSSRCTCYLVGKRDPASVAHAVASTAARRADRRRSRARGAGPGARWRRRSVPSCTRGS